MPPLPQRTDPCPLCLWCPPPSAATPRWLSTPFAAVPHWPPAHSAVDEVRPRHFPPFPDHWSHLTLRRYPSQRPNTPPPVPSTTRPCHPTPPRPSWGSVVSAVVPQWALENSNPMSEVPIQSLGLIYVTIGSSGPGSEVPIKLLCLIFQRLSEVST
jgi:hypothetical protein